MKKFIILFLLLFLLVFMLNSQENIARAENDIKLILNKVSPSIVKVVAENHKKYIATGIAIENDLILTSTLITRYPYDKIYIKTINNKKYVAGIVGKDPSSAMILLKIDSKALKPVKKATKVEVGDWIALVGVFYDSFPSIFQGIVSSTSDDELILNAPVAPGSSGGAVVNKKGELTAVIRGRFGFSFGRDISIKDHESEILFFGEKSRDKNLCYAIPVKKVMRITSQLKKYGKVKRGWLGITMTSGRKDNKVTIKTVVDGSPAEKAGIKKHDVIVYIDGKRVKSSLDVSKIMKTLAPDEVVKVKVERGKKLETVLVKLGELKEAKLFTHRDIRFAVPETFLGPEVAIVPELATKLPRLQRYVYSFQGSRKLGIDIVAITRELAKKFRVKEDHGLMISRIGKKSAAEKGGLEVGDIIVRANGKSIKTLSDMRRSLNSLREKEPLKIELYRNGKLKSFKIVPDFVKEVGYDWNRLRNRMKKFSINISRQKEAEEKLRERMERIELKLREQEKMARYMSEEEMKKLSEEIKRIKEEYRRQYEAELRRLEEERAKIKAEERRMYDDLIRIEKLKKLKEAELKKKIEEEKKKKKEKEDTTTL